ncbi:MAG: hypothetical protein VYD19_03965, partial [Myxococcota bacterium]|nr:hypothetical protein [Myxococcota bacterium]
MKRQRGAEEKKRSWLKAGLLGFTGSAALIILLLQLTGVDWRALQGGTLRADFIGLALSASALVWLLRGLRISALCAGVSLSDSLAIVAAQGLLLRVTPLRLGDLGLPFLLERRGVPLGEALLLLLWVRLTEL